MNPTKPLHQNRHITRHDSKGYQSPHRRHMISTYVVMQVLYVVTNYRQHTPSLVYSSLLHEYWQQLDL